MVLQLHEMHPGLWVDPNIESGPGTFAVIIGISRYDYLNGGKSQASITYELGQLHVSALTAFRFFGWLRGMYHFTDTPLRACWLLLAPTEEEVAYEPQLSTGFAEPSFAGCKNAIEQWHHTMAGLNTEDSRRSRALFFFSGHGFELHPEAHVLLPSDFPCVAPDLAINVRNIWAGLAGLPVANQFFFVDSCRSDVKHLRNREPKFQGTPILEVQPNYRAPRRNRPILYACAAGGAAHQPKLDFGEVSLYGSGLLDGLRAEAGFEPACDGPRCAVQFSPLQEFVDDRVQLLTRMENERRRRTGRDDEVYQEVVGGGEASNWSAPVTELELLPGVAPVRALRAEGL